MNASQTTIGTFDRFIFVRGTDRDGERYFAIIDNERYGHDDAVQWRGTSAAAAGDAWHMFKWLKSTLEGLTK